MCDIYKASPRKERKIKKKKKGRERAAERRRQRRQRGRRWTRGRRRTGPPSSGIPESPTVHHWSTPRALPSHSYTPGLSGRSSISKANIAPGWLLTFPFRDAW